MKLLYISALASARIVNEAHKVTGQNPGFAIQKFSRLLSKGFVLNGVDVTVLSVPPVYRSTQLYVNEKNEEEDGIHYHYIPVAKLPIAKHVCISVYAFFYVLFWSVKNRNDGAVVFDILKISMSCGGLLASKVVGIPTVGLVTDLPGLMVGAEKKWYSDLVVYINKLYIGAFSYYVFLTEQMNAAINKYNRPYMVMEGLVDADLVIGQCKTEKSFPKTLLYAGGLHERYGLKMLVDAFLELNHKDWQLEIYGNGPYVEELQVICSQYSNVVYKGVAPNDEVVAAEYRASILVNPRPTTEEFTQYSFPSKNMEYMVSGTPLLTTKLPGMPKEYYDYVYLFNEETQAGYKDKLSEMFKIPDNQLSTQGELARAFVLSQKNNIIQSNRIIQMLRK